MRTQICGGLLIVLLVHAATDRGLAADQILTSAEIKALAIYAPRPQYPYEARARKQAGSGVVSLVIDPATGLVTAAEMAKSTGWILLDHASVSAFRAWRFKPGSISKAKIPITFTMEGRVITELKVMKTPDMEEILTPFLGKGTVVRGPKPRYPLNPPWTNKQGKGTYELHVGKDGNVEEVKILKSSGDATFDRVVVSTLNKWRLRKGPMVVELPLAFKLTPRSYDLWIP